MKITVTRDEMIGNGLDQVSVIEVEEFCGAVIRPCNGPGQGTDLTFEEAVEAVKTGAEYDSWTLTEEESEAIESYVRP